MRTPQPTTRRLDQLGHRDDQKMTSILIPPFEGWFLFYAQISEAVKQKNSPVESSRHPAEPKTVDDAFHKPSAVGTIAEIIRSVVVEVEQATADLRVGIPPAVGEVACGGARSGDVRGVNDVVEMAFGVLPVGPAEFVGDVPDLVGPAAPDGDVGMD